MLIQPFTSSQNSDLGYQHLTDYYSFKGKNRYLPFKKTVFEVDLSKPKEAEYVLEHIANLMSTFETIFVFRPWTDLDNDPRYKDFSNREERMKQYFQDNSEGIVALDWEGPIKFENIHSTGATGLGALSYVLNSQGHDFFNSLVQNDLKKWEDVWIHKMGLSERGNFDVYYFDEIKNSNTARAKFLRKFVLNLELGGDRSVSNKL